MKEKRRAPRNRTITLGDAERTALAGCLTRLAGPVSAQSLLGRTICQDLFEVLPCLPPRFVDLLVVDPPYNLDKSFNTGSFKSQSAEDYAEWIDSWLAPLRDVLKPTASVYICCDWRCSAAVQQVAERYFLVQNRITWEREKGRGSLRNWKNCSEDIWFFTLSREYTFNVEAVKLKRRVIAPYTNEDGEPKDWSQTENGGFRLTHPSNLWTDISDDKNYFVVLMVPYDIEGLRAVIEHVRFVPIEFLGWNCLTVGALGWGQIQIAADRKRGKAWF